MDINLDNLTLGQIKEIKALLGNESNTDSKPTYDAYAAKYLVGRKKFFRTVTYHVLGRVVEVVDGVAILEDASWVADSGRFMDFLKKGVADEVEPTGRHEVHLATVVDSFDWDHELPKSQK